MQKYFVITTDGEEQFESVKTEKELAELWETNDEVGYLDEIIAFRYVDGKMERVNVYKIASAYLKERDEIRQEYEDYCEMVNEYGYDYADHDSDLEMGFNPYMGCYDYDC